MFFMSVSVFSGRRKNLTSDFDYAFSEWRDRFAREARPSKLNRGARLSLTQSKGGAFKKPLPKVIQSYYGMSPRSKEKFC